MGGQVQSTRFLFLGDQDAKLLSNTAVIVKETLGSVILFFLTLQHGVIWLVRDGERIGESVKGSQAWMVRSEMHPHSPHYFPVVFCG